MNVSKIQLQCLQCGHLWYQKINYVNDRIKLFVCGVLGAKPKGKPIICPKCKYIIGCKVPYGEIRSKYE